MILWFLKMRRDIRRLWSFHINLSPDWTATWSFEPLRQGARERGSRGRPDSCHSSPEELQESANGNNPFLLHVAVQSGLQDPHGGSRLEYFIERMILWILFWPPEAAASSVSESGTEESNSLLSHTLLSCINNYTLTHTTILTCINNYTLSHTQLYTLSHTNILSQLPY